MYVWQQEDVYGFMCSCLYKHAHIQCSPSADRKGGQERRESTLVSFSEGESTLVPSSEGESTLVPSSEGESTLVPSSEGESTLVPSSEGGEHPGALL